jgi:hypothetical protein
MAPGLRLAFIVFVVGAATDHPRWPRSTVLFVMGAPRIKEVLLQLYP